MSDPERDDPARELARGLARALEEALAPGADPLKLRAAREVAALLGLEATANALAAFEPHAGKPWPQELSPLRDRLLRTAERCAAAGDARAFRAADAEIAGLAEETGALEWTRLPYAPALATVSAARTLEDLPLDDSTIARLHAARLSTPGAAALRAALDWLDAPSAGTRVRVRTDDAVLDVKLPLAAPDGLDAAADVLAEAEGALLPPAAGDATWTIRLPLVGTRETFLMVEREGVPVAIPWSAIAQLQIVPAGDLEARAEAVEMPILWTPPAPRPAELPVATLVRGLRRAWFPATRIVWRLPAEPCPSEGAVLDAGFRDAVRTSDGEVYGRLDVTEALARVPATPFTRDAFAAPPPAEPPRAPRVAAPAPRPSARIVPAPPAPLALPSDAVTPIEADVPPVIAPRAPQWLGREAVTPLEPAAPPPPAEATAGDSTTELDAALDALLPSVSGSESGAPEPAAAPAAPARADAPGRERESAPASEPPTRAPEPVIVTRAESSAGAEAFVPPPAPAAPAATAREAIVPPPAQAPPALFAAPEAGFAPPAAAEPPAPRPFDDARRGFALAPEAPAPSRGRALVAEDSLVARTFLQRLLEREGYAVRGVERASELWSALEAERFDLLCVDVELPDARGEALLHAAVGAAQAHGVALVVPLTRDADDDRIAACAGLTRAFHKPFDGDEVRAVLERAGLPRREIA